MGHSLVFKHIPPSDINLTPFYTFKKWTSTNTNFSSSFGIKIKRAMLDEDWRKDQYPDGFATNYPNPDGSDQKTLWYNLNGMYYKDDKSKFDIEYSTYIVRSIHATASYVQIPQQYIGEGIKLHSVDITNGSVNLKDDGFGNIYDTGLDTGSMVESDYLLGYWGFNDKFKYNSQLYNRSYGTIKNILPNDDLSYINTDFNPGITTTGVQSGSSGLKATLAGDGCMYLNDPQLFNFKYDEDFAISLWVELPTNQTQLTGSYNSIVNKSGDISTIFIDKKSDLQRIGYTPYNQVKYPYDIKIGNSNGANNGKIVVSRCDVNSCPEIVSSTTLTGSQHHILFNKLGETLELWVDGVLDGSTTDTTDGGLNNNTHNNAILTLGSNGYNRGGLIGSLDEVRIYSKGLVENEIQSLANNDYTTGSAYNTPLVGNVFYPQGTMVISDPRPKYQNVFLGNGAFDYTSSVDDNFTLQYRSTLKMTENEVVCRVSAGEFNFTSNPTIREYNDLNSEFTKDFVSGSDWHPYVSTIGLYDEYGRMLAVGKTAQATPMLDTVETTFIVRYDE